MQKYIILFKYEQETAKQFETRCNKQLKKILGNYEIFIHSSPLFVSMIVVQKEETQTIAGFKKQE